MGEFDFNELERDDPVLGLEVWVAKVQSRKNTLQAVYMCRAGPVS